MLLSIVVYDAINLEKDDIKSNLSLLVYQIPDCLRLLFWVTTWVSNGGSQGVKERVPLNLIGYLCRYKAALTAKNCRISKEVHP